MFVDEERGREHGRVARLWLPITASPTSGALVWFLPTDRSHPSEYGVELGVRIGPEHQDMASVLPGQRQIASVSCKFGPERHPSHQCGDLRELIQQIGAQSGERVERKIQRLDRGTRVA